MLDLWDQEIRKVAMQIMSCRDELASDTSKPDMVLSEKKVRVRDTQTQLLRSIERIQTLARRPTNLPNRLKTLMYWTGVYADRLHQCYTKQVEVMGQSMWLDLVRTRLAGKASSSKVVEDADLLDMADRQARLLKAERFLQHRLVANRERKRELHQRYRTIGIEKANLEAASCMQVQFGKGLKDSQHNVTLAQLSKSFMHITWPCRLSASDYYELLKLEADISMQTQKISEQCKVMAKKGSTSRTKSRKKFQNMLLQLEHLRTELANRTTDLARKLPNHARPILMKKNPDHGKTSP